jgi:hypothetical protein
MNPRELGGNQGVDNFVPPIGTNLTSLSPAALGCFLAEKLLDLAPNQFDSEISLAYQAHAGFVKGTVAPFLSMTATSTARSTSSLSPAKMQAS